MGSRGTTLSHLCQCLQGSLPQTIDWMSVIGLANETLITPALHDIAERFPDAIPEDVRQYLQEIFNRNLARNDRLAEQLAEAVAALNGNDVTPVLVKGSAMLAAWPRMTMGRRLISFCQCTKPTVSS